MRVLIRNSVVLLAVGAAGCGDDSTSDPCSLDEPGTTCTWMGIKNQRGGPEGVTTGPDGLLCFVADLTFPPNGTAYIADFNNHRIQEVGVDDKVRTVFGSAVEGDGDPDMADRFPIGAPAGADALEVSLNHPTDIEFSHDYKTLYIAAWHNNKVRQMDMETHMVTVIAGDSYGFAGDDGPAYKAVFNQPKAIVVDDEGSLLLNDQRNQRVRKITSPGEYSTSMVKTIAGTGKAGFAGDGGPALDAQFSWDTGTTPTPSGGLALDDRTLYVADTKNHRIRAINPATGWITPSGGTGTAGSSGDGGPAMSAEFNEPLDIEIGPDGRLYVADSLNNAIRAIDLGTGVVDLVAGNAQQCSTVIYCYEKTETPTALELQLLQPWAVAFDPKGDLYIADTNNSRIVKVKQ